MKIWEIIGDYVSKTAIFEQAFSRKDVEANITAIADPVIEHLVKVLKWQDDLNLNKHLGDINSWLFKIQRQKIRGNKKPTQYDYYRWIFDDVAQNEQTIRLFVKGLHNYHHLHVIRTDEEVFDIIKNIIYQISFDMPLNNFTDIRNYYNFQ